MWASLALPGAAMADVVTNWVAVSEAVAPRFGGPQQQSRAQAMVQIAVHDALNAIVARYARYAWTGPVALSASPDAAVGAAARHVLLELLAPVPDSPLKQAAVATIEAAYVATVGPAPYDDATLAGLAVGQAAANAILTRRVGDGSDTPHLPYTLLPGPRRLPADAEPRVPGGHHALVCRLGACHAVLPPPRRTVRG